VFQAGQIVGIVSGRLAGRRGVVVAVLGQDQAHRIGQILVRVDDDGRIRELSYAAVDVRPIADPHAVLLEWLANPDTS
jgi:ribosomal protein L14E/L6E/L27E